MIRSFLCSGILLSTASRLAWNTPWKKRNKLAISGDIIPGETPQSSGQPDPIEDVPLYCSVGVGLDDLLRSLPAPNVLWFSDLPRLWLWCIFLHIYIHWHPGWTMLVCAAAWGSGSSTDFKELCTIHWLELIRLILSGPQQPLEQVCKVLSLAALVLRNLHLKCCKAFGWFPVCQSRNHWKEKIPLECVAG